MNNSIKNLILKTWPVLVVLGIILVIAFKNYVVGTWLIGWDNLMPELNFKVNILRSIFAVWQEYQGLGVLGGMGHATDLIHVLSLYVLSFILPLPILRYAWTFLMLFIGSIGTYFLIKEILLKDSDFDVSKKRITAFLGSAFYLLNLSTVQTFYAPFEAFTAHFAALPWLLFASLNFFFKPNLKNAFLLSAVLLIAAPQAYIPTLFLVYILSLTIIIFSLLILKPSLFAFKSFIKMALIIFLVNAFWLLPFLYFTITNSHVALDAKINQMSSETIFLQNKNFGDILDVFILKGFWFNNVDPDLKINFTYMFAPWRDYLSSPLIALLGYSFFAVIIAGVIASLKKSKNLFIAFFVLFIFGFTMLATNTPPFSWIDIIFRKIPLFNEAFRFPFTKFSILVSLTYAVFFALGVAKLSSLKIFKKINYYLFGFVFVVLLLTFVLPIFNGHLFYNKERLPLPKDYTSVIKYFNSQNENTRIANLPQPTFWGWEFYNWGYGGSGFPWYGIKQPILDRAFDVWSGNNENYYWEMSQAIYSKNPALFENVLNKYQVNWILVDNNIIYPSSPISLLKTETESMIAKLPEVKKTAEFGNIIIYKVSLKDNPKDFVFSPLSLKSANAYLWSNQDKAYSELGNYQSLDNNQSYYPFRSLFSNKNQENLQFTIKNEANDLLLENPIPKYPSGVDLQIPSFMLNERIITATFAKEKNSDGTISLSLVVKSPEISIIDKNKLNKTVVFAKNLKIPLIIIPKNYKETININVNGLKTYKLDANSLLDLETTFLVTNQDNIIVFNGPSFGSKPLTIKASALFDLFNIPENIHLNEVKEGSTMSISIPKVNDGYESFNEQPSSKDVPRVQNCDNFNKSNLFASIEKVNNKDLLKLEAKKSIACVSFYAGDPIHETGYAIFVQNSNYQGRPLHFWVLNEDEKFSPIDTYLKASKELNTASFIIPPLEEFGRAYSFHFDNIAILNDPTINYLGNISMYPIPYNFIGSIKFSDNSQASFSNLQFESTSHPNESLYVIKNVHLENKSAFVLSQSFNKGWQAYTMKSSNPIKERLPFIFGSEVKNHFLVNNWENGWSLDKTNSKENFDLVVIYTPQYLEFVGFLIIPILLAFILIFKAKKARKLDSQV